MGASETPFDERIVENVITKRAFCMYKRLRLLFSARELTAASEVGESISKE